MLLGDLALADTFCFISLWVEQKLARIRDTNLFAVHCWSAEPWNRLLSLHAGSQAKRCEQATNQWDRSASFFSLGGNGIGAGCHQRIKIPSQILKGKRRKKVERRKIARLPKQSWPHRSFPGLKVGTQEWIGSVQGYQSHDDFKSCCQSAMDRLASTESGDNWHGPV